jgi:hypothetical protein
MRRYKFIDNYNIEVYDKKYVILDGKQISYPSDEAFLRAGIKPLSVTEYPEYNRSTHRLTPYYEDMENHILKTWVIEEIPEEELLMMEDVILDE